MTTCRYCDEELEDNDELTEHLRDEHLEELSPIDQRRVDRFTDESTGFGTRHLLIGGVVLLFIIGVAFVAFANDDTEPTYDPSVHFHGTMEITIEGESLDLSGDAAFVMNDNIFHFHGGEADRYGAHIWHIHGSDVTLQYALGTLGISVNDEGTVLTVGDMTYDASEQGTEITITVNGDPVEPGRYELAGVGPFDQTIAGAGDDFVIVVAYDN